MTDNKIKKFSIQSFVRKAGHIMLIILSILLACVLALTGLMFIWSPGKPKPFLDENGEKLEVIYLNTRIIQESYAVFVQAPFCLHCNPNHFLSPPIPQKINP